MGKKWVTKNKKERKEETDVEQEETGKEGEKSTLEKTTEAKKKIQTEQPEGRSEKKQKERIPTYTPTVSFPQRLQKAKREEQFSRFLDIFKKIKINIPFAEVINQMPNYAKFLKEILNKKRKIVEE